MPAEKTLLTGPHGAALRDRLLGRARASRRRRPLAGPDAPGPDAGSGGCCGHVAGPGAGAPGLVLGRPLAGRP